MLNLHFYFGALFLVVHAILIPESPRWYCSHGMFEEAQEVTLLLHGDTEQARQEAAAMVESHQLTDTTATPRVKGEEGYMGLLLSSDVGLKRAVLIGTVLQV